MRIAPAMRVPTSDCADDARRSRRRSAPLAVEKAILEMIAEHVAPLGRVAVNYIALLDVHTDYRRMALLRPQVLFPLSELSRTIRVRGQVDGATVTIASVGANPRDLVTGIPVDDRLTLPPGIVLRTDDLLVAVQERGSDKSPAPSAFMTQLATVQAAPASLASIGHVNLVSAPWECGRHLWVDGGIPGAIGQAVVGGNVIGEAEFLDTEGARFALSPDLPHTTTVSVRQEVRSIGAGPVQNVLSLTLPARILPPPVLDPAPMACQEAVRVTKVFDGAEVVLTRTNGQSISEERADFDLDALWFPLAAPLAPGEELTIRQEVNPECKRSSPDSAPPLSVREALRVTPPSVDPVCDEDPLIHVFDLIPGAPVRITINGQPFDGQTPRDTTVFDFYVDQRPISGAVTVQQSQCGVWSEPVVVAVRSEPASVPPPKIVGPLFDCVTDVTVSNVFPGAIVQVFSRRKGPISFFKKCETPECIIRVAPALEAGDKISVTEWVCGGASIESQNDEPVQPLPKLTVPVVGTVYIGAASISITQLVPGARVRVLILDGTTGAIKQWVVVTATPTGAATANLGDPIADGDVVTARQFLCGELSDPGRAAATLQPITVDWWAWDGPSPVNVDWNREYTVGGTLTNRGATPLSDVHFTFWENTSSPGDVTPGHLSPGQSTRGAFPQSKQSWSWFTPGVWVVRGPLSKNFIYHIDITANAQSGQPYPLVSTRAYVVIVSVSKVKRTAGAYAEGAAIAAAALLVSAAVAAATVLGLFGPAEALAAAAAAAYAAAAGAGAVALDPPEPDPNFRHRVLLPGPTPPGEIFPTDLRSLYVLLQTMARVPTINLLMSTMEGRWLGALAANELDWARIQAQDFAQAHATLVELARTAQRLYFQAVPGLSPIVQRLSPFLKEMRQELLVKGISGSLRSRSALGPEILGNLDIVARSTDLAYPEVEPLAALSEAARLVAEFGAAVGELPLLDVEAHRTRFGLAERSLS